MAQSVENLVKESVRVPSSRFGELVMEVDHKFIGGKMKTYRIARRVKAIEVAKQLKISKTLLNFLENGKRFWTLEIMKGYIRAVKQAERERKA